MQTHSTLTILLENVHGYWRSLDTVFTLVFNCLTYKFIMGITCVALRDPSLASLSFGAVPYGLLYTLMLVFGGLITLILRVFIYCFKKKELGAINTKQVFNYPTRFKKVWHLEG